MRTRPCSAVIIGAGLSGMSAALLLASHGLRVTLVEQAALPGMTVRGFFRKGTYCNSGLHYVGELSEQGILRAYLRRLGLGDLPFVDFDPDCYESIRFNDGRRLNLPVGLEAQIKALSAIFPAEARGIENYMREVNEAYYASPFHSLADTSIISGENTPRWQISLTGMLDRHVHDQRLRTALSTSCWLHGVSPDDAPFLQHARVTGSHFDSVKTVAGGGRTLVAAFERRLEEEGVRLICGQGVKRVLFSSAAAVSGVELDSGEPIEAESVIYTGHPARLPDMLPEGICKPAFAKRLRLLKDSVSAHMLFLSAENCPEALCGKNLLTFTSDEALSQVFRPGRTPDKGPFYVLANPLPDKNADEKRSLTDITAFVFSDAQEYAPFFGSRQGKRPQAYKELKHKRLSQFSEALFTACPDLAGLRVLDGATPLTIHDYLHTPQGGMYGAAHNLSQFNPHPVTRLPNLYVSGQAVVAPGFMGAVISAFLTCGCIVGRDVLLNEVRACKR